MKLLVSREWLRNKIATDPDVETEAGTALAVLEGIGVIVPPDRSGSADIGDEKVIRLRVALGTLLRQLRHRDGLSVVQLAARTAIGEDEVRSIERDPHHIPRPRTLHQLASHFKLPVRHLMQMSGATRTVDKVLYNEAIRFAARSDDMSVLSDDEERALSAFVKLLAERADA